ncbi:MAG TPA: hypothetical protein VE090_04575 [Methylomirabilota bacterium]|nr:hypothetical protein [Methylomirabilota bacterium]
MIIEQEKTKEDDGFRKAIMTYISSYITEQEAIGVPSFRFTDEVKETVFTIVVTIDNANTRESLMSLAQEVDSLREKHNIPSAQPFEDAFTKEFDQTERKKGEAKAIKEGKPRLAEELTMATLGSHSQVRAAGMCAAFVANKINTVKLARPNANYL